jgi:hypothetical protein
MSANAIVIHGVVKADGTLVLEDKVSLPAGKVQVTVQPMPEQIPCATAEGQEQAARAGNEAIPEPSPSRNIAVAYEEVVLTEEDAEMLRRMREAPSPRAGRPVRPPRRMQDG